MEAYGSGKQLKPILELLEEIYPAYQLGTQIAESLKMDGHVFVRLIAYAVDKGWVQTASKGEKWLGPFRLMAAGVDKLHRWTGEDDRLRI